RERPGRVQSHEIASIRLHGVTIPAIAKPDSAVRLPDCPIAHRQTIVDASHSAAILIHHEDSRLPFAIAGECNLLSVRRPGRSRVRSEIMRQSYRAEFGGGRGRRAPRLRQSPDKEAPEQRHHCYQTDCYETATRHSYWNYGAPPGSF